MKRTTTAFLAALRHAVVAPQDEARARQPRTALAGLFAVIRHEIAACFGHGTWNVRLP